MLAVCGEFATVSVCWSQIAPDCRFLQILCRLQIVGDVVVGCGCADRCTESRDTSGIYLCVCDAAVIS